MDSKSRKWWKKKRYLLSICAAVLLVFVGLGGDTAPSTQISDNSFSAPVHQQIQLPQENPLNQSAGLSNDNYYTNSSGAKVHSPAYSNTAPVGASAQCRDGTYSFSQHRSGTCSHHGGVADWL